MTHVQQPSTSLNTATAYEIAADWRDKEAAGCADIRADVPRIEEKIRERAKVAAIHHKASAAGLRLAALGFRQKELARR